LSHANSLRIYINYSAFSFFTEMGVSKYEQLALWRESLRPKSFLLPTKFLLLILKQD
jgi:hypothetical protein